MAIGSQQLILLRIARVLFLYVAVSSGILVFGCLGCAGTARTAFMFVSSAIAALLLERRNRLVWAVALAAAAYGTVVFASRVPFYLWQYDLAVKNAGWRPFLWANSLFSALAIAGGLCTLSIGSYKSQRSS